MNRRFWFPAGSKAFYLEGAVIVADAKARSLVYIDLEMGTRRL
jgi:hypothetical protein